MNKARYRYYSVLRPVGIGTFPKGGVLTFSNFNTRKMITEIGREAWGFVEYDHELDEQEAAAYDLVPVTNACSGCVYEYKPRDTDYCWNCRRNTRQRPDNYRRRWYKDTSTNSNVV